MFTIEFLGKYPATTAFLKASIRKRVLASMDDTDIPVEYKEELVQLTLDDGQIVQIMIENPCTLFRYFDEVDVHVYAKPVREEGRLYYINCNVNDGVCKGATGFTTRMEAEWLALREAFEITEVLLGKEVTTE